MIAQKTNEKTSRFKPTQPIVFPNFKKSQSQFNCFSVCDPIPSDQIPVPVTQVILAFWLVLAYDLLEDRRTIDIITTKFFLL